MAHDLAAMESRRGAAVAMALRLARWLTSGVAGEARSLAEAVESYAGGTSFVDWAREALADGDTAERVSAAYGALVQKARNRRESVMGIKALLLEDLGCTLEEQWANERTYTTTVARGARAEAAFPEFIARKGRPHA